MSVDSTCQCTELTPAGRGAISSLLICGPAAAEKIAVYFRPQANVSVSELVPGRIYFGRWQAEADRPGEELVLCRISHDQFEIHCHGGRAAVDAIRGSLHSVGCDTSDWRAMIAEEYDDRIAAEATIALSQARTTRTAAILLDQFHGSLRKAIDQTIQSLEQDQKEQATSILTELVQQSQLGLHLSLPWRVVLAGRPNVGKSSLVNAILGFTRAIVFDQPGTTRDLLAATTAIDGWPIELADTAGVRNPIDDVERQGVARTAHAAAEADLIVLVHDAREPLADDDELHEQFPSALLVANKSDLCSPSRREKTSLLVSALTGENIAEFTRAIASRLVPQAPADGAGVPFTQRQLKALQGALDSVRKSDISAAKSLLHQI